MVARVDKTESAIAVKRGTLLADVASGNLNVPLGVGIDAAGRTVLGAGQSGVIGVMLANKIARKAGDRVDMFGNGTEIVDCVGLVAGTKYYASVTTGVISTTNTGTYVGYTIEADRLVVVI